MFKKFRKLLKKGFIYFFICLILISSPVVQDNIISNNTVIMTSFENIKQSNSLLSYNIFLKQFDVNMTHQISQIQQQGYGFIQIIFIILSWIIRIVIFIIKLIIRLLLILFTYLRIFFMYILRFLPNLIRIITRIAKTIFNFILKGVKAISRLLVNGVKKLIPLIKKGAILFRKSFKNIFGYLKKGISLLKKFFIKSFNKLKKFSGKISTSKKIVTSGSLGTVTSKQILATQPTKVTALNTKSIGKTSVPKIKNIRPGKQNTNLKYNKNLSPNIKKYIVNPNEKSIYNTLNLKETKINNRRILRRENMYNLNKKDNKGRTNLERMKQGLAPLDDDNHSIELHHIGQKMDSPLAELRYDEHKKYFGDIHNNFIKSEIDRVKFNKEKKEYWETLAKIYEESLAN
ncbi:HNH/ENDO VII family nuclease [Fusobacterium sp.]|uniref:HNH/ENDO VII family nuclease n=1 Tax=Fusobacterium sp. TaxID=68766 RepID=UPI00262FB067|nr:HNH/ENDO VII family nuclease [Fusobacterium sp.]